MFKKLDRAQSDSGDSTLVSTVIVLPLLMMIIFTIIDFSIWASNKSLIQDAARDSARSVAIMGGTDSPLSDRYGVNESAADGLENKLRALNSSGALSNVTFVEGSIECGPGVAAGVGDETYCTTRWEYGGFGFSAFNIVASMDGKNNAPVEEDVAFYRNTTRGTAESEVGFNG